MNFPWAICVTNEEAAALAPLRLQPGVEVAESVTLTWLRGPRGDDQVAKLLAALPATARYQWYPQKKRLRRLNERLSATPLPELPWQPLSHWLSVESPAHALPASLPAPVNPRLVRSAEEQEAHVLLSSFSEFELFVRLAAQVRLECLQFAVAADGQVLIRGTPLPPVAGRRYVLYEQSVAVPAGYTWTPAVSPKVLKRMFNASANALVLWQETGTITVLPEEQFLPVTRRAVRATEAALAALA